MESFAFSEVWNPIIQKVFWLAITFPVIIKAGLIWSCLCLPRKCWGIRRAPRVFTSPFMSKKFPSHALQGSGKGREGWILWPKPRLLVNCSYVLFIISFTSAELASSSSISFYFHSTSQLPVRRNETEVSSFTLNYKGSCSLFPHVQLNASRNTLS